MPDKTDCIYFHTCNLVLFRVKARWKGDDGCFCNDCKEYDPIIRICPSPDDAANQKGDPDGNGG